MVSEHAYTRADLGRDYMRGLIGLAICAAPFAWVEPANFVIAILAVMACIFLALLWQTAMRQISRVIVDDDGITLIAIRRRTIPWNRLQRLELSYFTTWKNLSGFMELKLTGGAGAIRIGSGLIGFRDVVVAATRAAVRNRLDFKDATIANLRSIDIADPRIDTDDDHGDDA